MSRNSGTSNDAPPTPGEQAASAQQREREQRRVPSASAPSSTASAGSVSPDTVARSTVDRVPDDAANGVGDGHRRARPADGDVAVGEVEVECPGCGLLLVGDSPRPTAAWFCPKCDFPVFWASPSAEPPVPQRRARRRLPGTAGREILGAQECWHCGERNEPGITVCPRCAATLPKPTAPTPEPVVVEVERVVAVPHLVRSSTWPFVAAGLLGGSAIAITATLLILRVTGALVPGALGGLW